MYDINPLMVVYHLREIERQAAARLGRAALRRALPRRPGLLRRLRAGWGWPGAD